MSRVLWEGYFQLDIRSTWQWSEEDGVVSIFDPDGVGALQVSFAKHEEGVIVIDLDGFTRELASSVGLATPSLGDSTLDGARGVYTEGIDDGRTTFWRLWHFARGARVACVTYCSAPEDRDDERSAVDEMMTTWRWL